MVTLTVKHLDGSMEDIVIKRGRVEKDETFAKSVEIETIARIGNDCGCTQTVEPATQQTEETPCPNRKMLKNLCMMISGAAPPIARVNRGC